jgi:hypothetical protein
MPKILRNQNANLNENKIIARKESHNYTNIQKSYNTNILDNGKKPKTSVEKKKPTNIFPKILPSKAPPSTANSIGRDIPVPLYKSSNLNENKIKREIYNEADKDEDIDNNYKINVNYDINHNNNINNNINSKNNDAIEEKKFYNNKINVDINKYKDISINFLTNNNELNEMFVKLYKDDYNTKKKWVNLNLFEREIFKIRLETYVKKKMDIPSFIKNEIYKLLSNQYCDYIFAQSYKEIQSQCDEHLKDIDDLFN